MLARAVHYAHTQGVVHRDLKPANVLVVEGAAESPESGILKITDFGLAKRLDVEKGQTESGVIVGTASYMAPEQAGGRVREIGPTADVYALGAILYELLTGRPPFQGESPMETLLQVLAEDPLPPGRLLPRLPRDLESICLKCLEKAPPRRYATALNLAEDLSRFLAGEPVRARPANAWDRAWKWGRRRPAIAALGLAVVIVAVTGFTLVTWQWQRAERGWGSADSERGKAELAREDAEGHARAEADARRAAELLSSRLLVDHALSLFEHGEYGHGALSLVRALETAPDDDAHHEHVRRLLDGSRSYLHRQNVVILHDSAVSAAAIRADNRMILTGTVDGVARLWNTDTGELAAPPLALPRKGPVKFVAFSPDSTRALTISNDIDISLWDAATGRRTHQLIGHVAPVVAAVFNHEGTLLVTGDKAGTVCLWDTLTGKQRFAPLTHLKAVTAVAFRPGGRLLLTASDDGSARFWDINTGKPVGQPLIHGASIQAVAFSRDGTTVTTGGTDGTARLWDVATGRLQHTYRHGAAVTCIAFHPRFNSFLTGGSDRHVRFWSTTTESPVGAPLQLPEPVRALAYNREGDSVLVGCGNTAEVWDPSLRRRLGEPLRHRGPIQTAAISADGRSVLTASEDGTAILWQAPPVRLCAGRRRSPCPR